MNIMQLIYFFEMCVNISASKSNKEPGEGFIYDNVSKFVVAFTVVS